MAGYDIRQQNIEKAHGIEQKDWNALIKAISPKEGERILDLMGGNGAVASKLYDYTSKLGIDVNLGVMDAFPKQLERAPAYLERIVGDVRKMPSESESYDTIIIKMGLHELSLNEQETAVKEIYRTLKPEGKLVLWVVGLEDFAQQESFHRLIRKKDEIAGFDEFVRRRYFPTIQETKSYLEKIGFKELIEYYKSNPKMYSSARLNGDFAGDKSKLEEWHKYIRTNLLEFERYLEAKDLGDSIEINSPVCIIQAKK